MVIVATRQPSPRSGASIGCDVKGKRYWTDDYVFQKYNDSIREYSKGIEAINKSEQAKKGGGSQVLLQHLLNNRSLVRLFTQQLCITQSSKK